MNPDLLSKADSATVHRVLALIDDHINADDVGQHDRLAVACMTILTEIHRRPAGLTEYAHALEILTAVVATISEACRATLIKLR